MDKQLDHTPLMHWAMFLTSAFGVSFCFSWLVSVIAFPILKNVPLGMIPIAAGMICGWVLTLPVVRLRLNRWLAWPNPYAFWSLVLATGLGLRILAIVVFPHEPQNDPRLYHQFALSMLAGKEYGGLHGRAFYPPGMSFLLMGWYTITTSSVLAGQLLNALLGTASIALVSDVARRVISPLAARWAGLLAAVIPTLVFYASTLGYEIVLGNILLAVCDLWLISVARGPKRIACVAAIGLLLGFGSLVKPICLLVPIVLFIIWLVKCGFVVATADSAVVAALMLVVIAPWTYRNYRVLGAFVPISTNGGIVLWTANNSESQGLSMEWKLPAPTDEVLRERYYQRAAIDWIVHNPLGFVQLAMRKFVYTWGTTSSLMSVISYDRMPVASENLCKAVLNFFWGIVLACCLVATMKFNAWGRPALLPVYALLAYVFAIHLIYEAMSRHHIPVVWALLLIAVQAFVGEAHAGIGDVSELYPRETRQKRRGISSFFMAPIGTACQSSLG